MATMMTPSLPTTPVDDRPIDASEIPISGLASDIEVLAVVALRDRWSVAIASIGWIHLGVFLICQFLYSRGDRSPAHFIPLWGLDVVGTFLVIRNRVIKRAGVPVPSLFWLVARIWATFLILAFSATSLNSLIGFQTDWFKAIWATLSTFGFATMAWIFHLRFLIPAVQMSLTAFLIARYPAWAYAIYGASWCLALNLIGLEFERLRRRRLQRPHQVSR